MNPLTQYAAKVTEITNAVLDALTESGEIDKVIAANQRETQCIDLALGDGLTPEYLASRWPGVDFAALLDDPAVVARVELYAANPQIQRIAADMVARRNVADALSVLRRKLADPDCSAAVARDIADLSLKQASQLGPVVEWDRKFLKRVGEIAVLTITGRQFVKTGGREAVQVSLDVIKAMRCQNRDEVERVVEAVVSPVGSVTLRGM